MGSRCVLCDAVLLGVVVPDVSEKLLFLMTKTSNIFENEGHVPEDLSRYYAMLQCQ